MFNNNQSSTKKCVDATDVAQCILNVCALVSYNYVHACRSVVWWERVVLGTFTDRDWIENFRVSKKTFYMLCDKLKPSIQRSNAQLRKSICVEQRVAITLWCLATCSEYRTIGHLFGVARCTVCVIVHDTCKAIVEPPEYLHIIPTRRRSASCC